MSNLVFLVCVAVYVAWLIWDWRASVRLEKLKRRRAARRLRMEARLLVCQDRYYSGRAAAAINGFGRALAREGWGAS